MDQTAIVKKRAKPVNVVMGLAVVFGVTIFVFCAMLVAGHFVEQSWSKVPSCEQLSSEAETQAVLQNNSVLVAEVSRAGGFEISAMPRSDCPGRSEIFIYYSTFSQGRKIRHIIGDRFIGLPYQMANM